MHLEILMQTFVRNCIHFSKRNIEIQIKIYINFFLCNLL
jgi:hypothetical protein